MVFERVYGRVEGSDKGMRATSSVIPGVRAR